MNSPTGLKNSFPECSGNQDFNFARLVSSLMKEGPE